MAGALLGVIGLLLLAATGLLVAATVRARALPDVIGETRVDMGNLYRVLRALEEDGIVTSEWRDDAPGPTKRIYELTEEGRNVLERWAEALRVNRELVSSFLDRYEKGGDHVPRT